MEKISAKDRLHGILKGMRIGDVVTTKTLKPTQPYTAIFVRRGYLVRFEKGSYRVLREFSKDGVSDVVDLYNEAQYKRRGGGRSAVKAPAPAPANTGSGRRTQDQQCDDLFSLVKNLRSGDAIKTKGANINVKALKNLYRRGVVARAGRSRASGSIWKVDKITRGDLYDAMFGKRRRSGKGRKAWIEQPPQKLESWTYHGMASNLSTTNDDGGVIIKLQGFNITLSNGTITISK